MDDMEFVNGLPVIRPQLKEAVLSWILRLSLATGSSPRSLLSYLGVSQGQCFEGTFNQKTRSQIEKVLGYECPNFWLNVRVSENIYKMKVSAKYLHRYEHPARLMFRFCPKCLHYEPTAYFKIEWGFEFVRYCPQHKVLLETKCPHCGVCPFAPFSPFENKKDRGPISTLLECAGCGQLLYEVPPVGILVDRRSCPLTDGERMNLLNGMATMASLVFGYGKNHHTSRRLAMPSIGKFIMNGSTPNKYIATDAALVRGRRREKHGFSPFRVDE